MATPALVIDEEAVFDAPLDGLLGCLHHLCRNDRESESEETCGVKKSRMHNYQTINNVDGLFIPLTSSG